MIKNGWTEKIDALEAQVADKDKRLEEFGKCYDHVSQRLIDAEKELDKWHNAERESNTLNKTDVAMIANAAMEGRNYFVDKYNDMHSHLKKAVREINENRKLQIRQVKPNEFEHTPIAVALQEVLDILRSAFPEVLK